MTYCVYIQTKMTKRRLSFRIQLLLLVLALCLLTSHLSSRSKQKRSTLKHDSTESFSQTAKSFKSDFLNPEDIAISVLESNIHIKSKLNRRFLNSHRIQTL